MRPVFAEERLLLEAIEGEPFKYVGKSVWNTLEITILLMEKIKFSVKDVVNNKNVDEIRKIILQNKIENKNMKMNYLKINI